MLQSSYYSAPGRRNQEVSLLLPPRAGPDGRAFEPHSPSRGNAMTASI